MLKRVGCLIVFLYQVSVLASDSFSISGGVVTLSDQGGYALQVTSPYLFDRLAVQLQGGQNYVSSQAYALFELGLIAPLVREGAWQLQFKTAIQRYSADSISSYYTGGLHYTLGAQYSVASKLAVLCEAGYSLPWSSRADKISNEIEFGKGISLFVGPKLFF